MYGSESSVKIEIINWGGIQMASWIEVQIYITSELLDAS